MTTILIVDDEQDMRNLVEIMLRNQGFQTITASGGEEAYSIVAQNNVDLVLLDVMMPNEDGFSVCKNIHKLDNIPVIFLTARDANEDKVKGLLLGGDDYIVKPFTVSELAARIQAVLRRAGNTVNTINILEEKYIKRGPIYLDEISRKVSVNGQPLTLTLKEYKLLYLFLIKPQSVYSREQLLEKIWDASYEGGTRTVDTHIKTLRLKLAKHSSVAADAIETVWGIGYRFGDIE